MSDLIDGINGVSAGGTIVSMVGSALIGARSVTVEVNNNTAKPLRRHSRTIYHGRLVRFPSAIIPPQGSDVFSAASKDPSVGTGTEGLVRYIVEGEQTMITIMWDNPYIGSNQARARIDFGQSTNYVLFGFTGDGNTAAGFRFELFEASRFPWRKGGQAYIDPDTT
jgi:hypothetical protein